MSRKKHGKGGARHGRGPARRGSRRGGRERGAGRHPDEPLESSVLRVLSGRGRPQLSLRDLSRKLDLGRGGTAELRRAVRALRETGRVERSEGRYRLTRGDGLIEGVLLARAQVEDDLPDRVAERLSSWVVLDDAGRSWSVGERLGEAQPGDRVSIAALRGHEGRAEVIGVVRGERGSWVGVIEAAAVGYEVTPYRDSERWRIRVKRGDQGAAQPGDVVEVVPVADERPRARGGRAAMPRGRVVARFGPPGEPEADHRAVVWRHRLPTGFSEAALAEADAHPTALEPSARAALLDLRDCPFLTIDPASARDHDDALYLGPPDRSGAPLYVAIADVARYVPEGSALDYEAWLRGNSVYFPDRAIPMLPERLSGDLCSLRPDVDRPALVVEMVVDRRGEVKGSRFHRALIRSRARLSYAQAARVMEAGVPSPDLAPEVREQLERLAKLARAMIDARRRLGALDFELPEAIVALDDRGRPQEIFKAERTLAHRAVEECMLAANRSVARALHGAGRACVHRVHEPPSPEKLDELHELYARFGLIEGPVPDEIDAPTLARWLRSALGHAEEPLVNMLTLRAMKQARYSARPLGHFALAFEDYLHFTSPIRRYADLVVHRQLLAWIAEGAESAEAEEDPERLEAMERIALRTSARERIAVAAEREMVDLKKCQYMLRHLGQVLDGTVTGAASQGLYVTLDEHFVEGLVPMARLPGYFEFDEQSFSLFSRGTGQRFALGQKLRVRVVRVDQLRGWVNFAIEGFEDEPEDARAARRVKGRPRGPKARRRGAPTRRRTRR